MISVNAKVLVCTYLFIWYVLPFLVFYLFDFESAIYNVPALNFYGQMYFIIIGITVLWRVVSFSCNESPMLWRLDDRKYINYESIFLLILLVIAMFGYASGMSGWRYSPQGLSEDITSTKLLYAIIPTILEFILLTYIFYKELNFRRKINLLMIAVTMLFSASGIRPMLLVSLCISYLLFPDFLHKLLFKQRAENITIKSSLMGFVIIIITFSILGTGLILGESIKTGVNIVDVISNYADSSFNGFFNYIIERSSTAYISLLNAISNDTSVPSRFQSSLMILGPIENLQFRIDAILGNFFGVDRPDFGSFMRHNYDLITKYPLNFREGTSPGLLASFVLAADFPISILLLLLYTTLILKLINRLLAGVIKPLSLLGGIIFLSFIDIVFASPLDLLLLIDNMNIFIFLLIGLAYFSPRLSLEAPSQAYTGQPK